MTRPLSRRRLRLTAAALGCIVSSEALMLPARSPLAVRSPARLSIARAATSTDNAAGSRSGEAEVVVVGSGLAGLCCAALLAHSGKQVVVCESHSELGGCAHSWSRHGYHFESGPSLYSGFSTDESPNPLKGIFQIIGEEPEWLTYDRWGTALPEGQFAAKIGPEEFTDVLRQYGGPNALEEWQSMMERVAPLSLASQALTSLALREDPGVLFTLTKYPRELLTTIPAGPALNEPFVNILREANVQDRFIRNWLDMLCFLLQGLPADGTLNAVMAYMLADWYKPGVTLDFPKGGSGAIVAALERAIVKNGGTVHRSAHVEEILVEGGKARGVRLRARGGASAGQGDVIKASAAVVANTDVGVTRKLVARGASPRFDKYIDGMIDDTPRLKSFIHLHAGIDATGLPTTPSADFPAQWAVVGDWDLEEGVEAPRNVVLVSIPSMIDPDLAPEGKHIVHAYVPATEPYEWWEGMDRRSEEYKRKKDEAADFLWSAVEKYIPDARQRSDPRVLQVGTPLTHERFLRRGRGSYGPRVVAGEQTLPGHKTPLDGLLLCGDFTFPGIGVPATAASGAITAHSLISVPQHLDNLNKLRLPDFFA